MNLVNCRSCGELFLSSPDKIRCNTCQSVFDENVRMVKDYLYSCPKATAEEIHDHTGVAISIIIEMMRTKKIH